MIEQFRNPELAKDLIVKIKKEADTGRQYRFMEVCGSHTMAVSKFGIRDILPDNVHLISGPGCPVCVTPQNELDAVFQLASRDNVKIATFGDMMRVPGSKGETLMSMKADGADVQVIYSPLDVLKTAEKYSGDVVFIGIGFETTAPTIAALAKTAKQQGADNVYITPFNKTMPEVIGVLLNDERLDIDGFISPGHVTAVTGISLYDPIVNSGRGAAVTGFEPVDVLAGVLELIRQTNKQEFEVSNMYSRVVRDEGNPKALELLSEVFVKADSCWRGIGIIEKSGLAFSEAYKKFDALASLGVTLEENTEIKGCMCGDVLKGYISPEECGLFADTCTPENPVGPCMVSSEGSCSAYYKYNRRAV